jgi:hypothetical protein
MGRAAPRGGGDVNLDDFGRADKLARATTPVGYRIWRVLVALLAAGLLAWLLLATGLPEAIAEAILGE